MVEDRPFSVLAVGCAKERLLVDREQIVRTNG